MEFDSVFVDVLVIFVYYLSVCAHTDLNVKDEVYQAIQNVRSDDNETKW